MCGLCFALSALSLARGTPLCCELVWTEKGRIQIACDSGYGAFSSGVQEEVDVAGGQEYGNVRSPKLETFSNSPE